MDSMHEDPRLVSLLERLSRDPTDEGARSDLLRLCGPRIQAWCRNWGLQEADAQDVRQQVLLELAEKMRTFTYDPTLSFLQWLKNVTRNTWSDWIRQRERRRDRTGEDEVPTLLEQMPVREDLARRLEEQYDQELLVEAFWLLALEGLPAHRRLRGPAAGGEDAPG
jgi:RNA polymerase sigma-70 factor (ECF subfamily)